MSDLLAVVDAIGVAVRIGRVTANHFLELVRQTIAVFVGQRKIGRVGRIGRRGTVSDLLAVIDAIGVAVRVGRVTADEKFSGSIKTITIFVASAGKFVVRFFRFFESILQCNLSLFCCSTDSITICIAEGGCVRRICSIGVSLKLLEVTAEVKYKCKTCMVNKG